MGQRPDVENTVSNVSEAEMGKRVDILIKNSGATKFKLTKNSGGTTWTIVYTRPGNG
jgi:hypothetical protein